MARPRVVTRRPGRTIDFKQWAVAPSGLNALSGDQTFFIGSLAFSFPATILRVRGFVWAAMDQTKQLGDLAEVTWGLAVLSTDAVTAGVGSVPDPAGDADFPWMWWGSMQLDSFVSAAEEVWGTTAQRQEVDTKAMRKIKPNESVLMIGQIGGSVGAPVIDVAIGKMRMLIGT